MPLPMMAALIPVLFFTRWTDRHHLNSEPGIQTRQSRIILRKGGELRVKLGPPGVVMGTVNMVCRCEH
jgi:hypothetical protein